MARTSSLSFPNMIDVSRNIVSVKEDNLSIINRTRLLILSDPTELYNDPTFGVGLRRYLWQYNTANTRAMIQDRIVSQLRDREPCVKADETIFTDGLVYTGEGTDTYAPDFNQLKMTVGLVTTYEDKVTIDLNSEDVQKRVDAAQSVYTTYH